MPQITANGVKLHFEETGAGAPMLLIMGLGAQLTRWPDAFVDRLAAEGFKVIRFDNRDVGLSQRLDEAGPPDMAAIFQALASGQKPPAAYDLADMAADAVGLLDALAIDRAHVVGASMGGMIGQIVAADYPQRVLSFASIMSSSGGRDLPPAKPEALAILNTPSPDPHTDLEAFLDRAVQASRVIGSPGYPADEKLLRERAETDFRRSHYPVGFQRQYAGVLASPERRTKLTNITAPTVVIHGADDPLVPVEAGRDTARHIKGAELVIIPGMGHDLPVELYGQMVEAIARNARRASS